jgi:hypothetical protein
LSLPLLPPPGTEDERALKYMLVGKQRSVVSRFDGSYSSVNVEDQTAFIVNIECWTPEAPFAPPGWSLSSSAIPSIAQERVSVVTRHSAEFCHVN